MANSDRHNRIRKPVTRYLQPIPRSVNQYEVLQNVEEPTEVLQSLDQENNGGTEVKKKRNLRKKKT